MREAGTLHPDNEVAPLSRSVGTTKPNLGCAGFARGVTVCNVDPGCLNPTTCIPASIPKPVLRAGKGGV
jgi:hypothetical protein